TWSPPVAGWQTESFGARASDRRRQAGLVRHLACGTLGRIRVRLQRRAKPQTRTDSAVGPETAPATGPGFQERQSARPVFAGEGAVLEFSRLVADRSDSGRDRGAA